MFANSGKLSRKIVGMLVAFFLVATLAIGLTLMLSWQLEGVAAAMLLTGRIQDPVSVGAVVGGDPAPGFDFGNSPSQLMQADLAGKNIVLSTAAGVCGLQRFRRAPRLYAASLVCARATAEAIRAAGAKEVCFVITGEWVDRDGDEDIACADYIESLLRGDQPAAEEFAQRVRASDFGQRFTAGTWPNLPLADLELAAQPDLYSFAMPVIREDEHLIIRTTG